jgi:tRNA nucleotidyltransferase/poly(A) polymerase
MKIFASHPDYTFVLELCKVLKKSGYRAWLAGGCVRDGLLGVVPHDFDIATDASPDEVEKLFPKTLNVGKSFGVIRVLGESSSGRPCDIEVASFRKDGLYVDGRRPVGIEKASAEEDAARRDFTVNAMFWDPFEDQIHDFVGGFRDLQAKVIRAVGDPRSRFKEDRLRMLRAVRFVMQLGFALDPLTEQALIEEGNKTSELSGERVSQELSKMLVTDHFDAHFLLLLRSGVFEAWLPVRSGERSLFLLKEKPVEARWAVFFVEWMLAVPLDVWTQWMKNQEMARRWAFSGEQKKTLELLYELISCPESAEVSLEKLGSTLKKWCSLNFSSWKIFCLSLTEPEKIFLKTKSSLFSEVENKRPDLFQSAVAWKMPEPFVSFEQVSRRFPDWSESQRGQILKKGLELQLIYPQKSSLEIEEMIFSQTGEVQ